MYSVKSSIVLNTKSLDVLRRMLLLGKATYYRKHSPVANDARYGAVNTPSSPDDESMGAQLSSSA